MVDGELTLHGITRPSPSRPGPLRRHLGGFSATTKINRKDFGIDTELPLDGGRVVIGDTVQISLDIQVVLVS